MTKVTGRRVRAPWIDALGIQVYLTDDLPENIKARLYGTTLVLNSHYEDELVATIMHEMEHVRQDRQYGPVSRLIYTGGAVVGAIRGDPYGKNPLEVSAEQQAERHESRVQAEQIARRKERGRPGIPASPTFYTVDDKSVPVTLSGSVPARVVVVSSDGDWNVAYVQALSKLYGVDADFIRRRWQILQDLMPAEAKQRVDIWIKWWNQLSTFDKVFVVGLPGQPALRDGMRTTAILNKDPRVQAFLSDPRNAQWWYASRGGQAGGTAEQKAFAKWYGAEWDRVLGSGQATQEYLKSPFWAQFRADMISSLPYMLVGGAVKWPADIALEKVLYPGLRLAWRGLRAISPGTARLFMRTSEAVGDLMTEQVINRIKALQVPQEIRDALLEKARPFLDGLRKSWSEFSRQKTMHYGDARQVVLRWNRELGLNGNHWLVAERVLAEKNNVWKEWMAVTQEGVEAIDVLKAQFAATTDPKARAIIQQQIVAAQTQLRTAANQFRARLQGITVDAVVKGNAALGLQGMNLKFAPEDAVKVGQLMGRMKGHFDSLYPPGKAGYQPFYYPEPNEAFAGAVARLKELPAVTKWWEIERWMVGGSDTPEQAINKFIYRTAAPDIIRSAEVQRVAYMKFIDDLSTLLTPTMQARLKESLRAAGVEVADKQVNNIISAATNPLLSFWRNSVLAGRFVPWTTINTLGNMTVSLEYLVVQNWMKGRWVSPWTFLKGMADAADTPLYVLESFGRSVGQEGGKGVFSRAMAKLYGVNAWIESAFRSGVYRAEFEAVSKELAAKGVAKTDIPQLAARFGWDKVDQILYNYGDKYWGAKFLQPIAPFTTFKVENLRFWMREMAQNPWLLRAMVQTVQAHPEWNIRTESLIRFFDSKEKNLPGGPVNALVEALYYLRELGIDGRTIDLVSKANYFDILGQTGKWTQPAWLKDREKVLANDLALALEKYANNPKGFEAYLKQRPELKAYYDYAQQHVAWKLLDFSLGALGTNFLADETLQKLGVQRARQFNMIFPQQRLFALLLGKMGQEWGIDLASKWAEPTDAQLRSEKQLLKMLGLSTGDDAKDTELARQRWWVRNLVDASLDLGLISGTLKSDLLTRLYETTKQELGSKAGVRFAPDPERVYRIMEQYKQYGISDPLWASILAQREQMRDIETATPEQRRQRQAAFDLLSDELKDLIKTSGDPQVAAFWKRVDDAFSRWQKMDPAERRRFLQNYSSEAGLVLAMLDTRYTPPERAIVNQVEGMYPKERESWYLTANAADRELFRQLYPREAAVYDSQENKGVPPTYIQPAAPDSGVAPTPLPHPAMDPKDTGFTDGIRPPTVAVSAPSPSTSRAVSPVFQATLTSGTYVAEQVASAIGGVESGGAYDRLSYSANPGKGHALGKYQFLPQTIAALGYGKYLDSTDPKDFMDPVRAKQLAKRWLENPRIQDQAMADLIRANAKSLGFGEGPYTEEQVGYLALAHVGGVGLAKRVQADPSLANRIKVGPNTSVTVGQYRDKMTSNVTFIPPSGREAGKGRVPQPIPKTGANIPQSPSEWYAQRKVNVAEGGLLIDYPGGLLQAMKAYVKSVNPDLDDKQAQKIVDTIHSLYADPQSGVPGATRGFDPLWILAVIAERTGFDPNYDKGGRKGVMGLPVGLFGELTDETVFDITKNIKAGVTAFVNLQRQQGTQRAVEQFGVDYKKTEVRATSVLGLRPVAVSPLDEKRQYRLLSQPDSERERKFSEFYAKLLWAGGNPKDSEFLSRRGQEWVDLAKRAEPWQMDLLRDHFPDLFYAVKEAREGTTYWFQGKFVLERGDPNYIAWKHRVLAAPSLEKAVEVYKTGSVQFREWFAYNNGDMALFFKDYLAGVSRDYTNYEFSDSQDQEKYLPARRKLALALATGDVRKIKQTVSEITSIYGDDVSGFARKLKEDTPALFEAVKPYLLSDARTYGPDDRLKVRQFLQSINHQLEDFRRTGNQEAIQVAAAMWNNPENVGLKSLVFDHETDQYDNIERRLAGVPDVGHFISDEDYVTFQRFAQALQTSYNGKNMEQMRAVWQAAPESFRKEFQAYHNSYYDYEPMLNGEEPTAWVEQRERALSAPYQHYIVQDDAFGAYSPRKLLQVLQENPAAFNYLMSDPEFRQNFRAAQQNRLVGLYGGVLRQYNYNPTLLNAIPDDGTRSLLAMSDPNAEDAFRRYKITVTPLEQSVTPNLPTLYDKYGRIEPELDDQGQPTGNYIAYTTTGRKGEETVQQRTISADQMAKDYAAILQVQTASEQFKQIQQQFQRNQAIVQGINLVYQGVRISQQGGSFVEQLPAYYQAAQAAASAGLFTGPAAGFLLGPTGFLVGGVLGILGGIFGENRQRAEEERRRKEQEAALRQQAIDQAAAVAERIRGLTSQQLEQLAGRQVREFAERPSAITRQALFDALVVPRPNW